MRRPFATAALVAAALLGACSFHYREDPDCREPARRAPEIGVQVTNGTDRTILCVIELVPTAAEVPDPVMIRRVEVPPPRRHSAALGGDPEASRIVRFVVEHRRHSLRIHTPSGTFACTLHPGERSWALATVFRDQLTVIRDSGPRFLE